MTLNLRLVSLCLITLAARAGAAHADGPCDGATLNKGQQRIDQGRYGDAITIYSCVLAQSPSSLDAYRGRAEANLLLDRYSDAMRDYAQITAKVMPGQPDAVDVIWAGYDQRLAKRPNDVAALTGASFARWWYYDHHTALPLLGRLLVLRPGSLFGTLYRGSTRLFAGEDLSGGKADLETAIQLAPTNPHVRFIVADAYTYASPDPVRARTEATLALQGGLDTPRVHAILASAAFALGDNATGALEVQEHIEQVTQTIETTSALSPGGAVALDLVPGHTFEIPIVATAGELLVIRTESPSETIWDSIAVLNAPDGTPVVGNDDLVGYLAGFDWTVPASGTYLLRVTSFEGVSTGDLLVTRAP